MFELFTLDLYYCKFSTQYYIVCTQLGTDFSIKQNISDSILFLRTDNDHFWNIQIILGKLH